MILTGLLSGDRITSIHSITGFKMLNKIIQLILAK